MAKTDVRTTAENRCFGGVVSFHEHPSQATGGEMRFSAYVPPQAENGPVPVLYYLAGLTCTEETFQIKAGAQRYAAEHGIMLVSPDTSPRDAGIEGEDDDYDFGTGAGFYLDAELEPYSERYRMYSYVTAELPELLRDAFPGQADTERQGIFGHSMGGHGALVLALGTPSFTVPSPRSRPRQHPCGRRGARRRSPITSEKTARRGAPTTPASWCASVRSRTGGRYSWTRARQDEFLDEQLYPHVLEEACEASGQKLTLRRHEGYDHSYYFISTFMEDHIRHHAQAFGAT